MCIPHGVSGTKSAKAPKERVQRKITKVSQSVFEHGDPDYKDEMVKSHPVNPKKASTLSKWVSKLLSSA